jgi:hypothetical protein
MEEIAARSIQQLKIEDESKEGALETLAGNIGDSPKTPRYVEGTCAMGDQGNDAAAEEVMLDREPSSVALCRKVLPILDDEDAACCSICLDDFTQEDPAVPTTCG